jgi:pilus assembly protein CpaE
VDAAESPEDVTRLKAMLTEHPSGVHALCAPSSPAGADKIDPDTATRLIGLMSSLFDTTVVDTSAGLDEFTLAALDQATDLLIVSTTDLFCIRGTRKLLDVLELIDIGEPDRHLVLNRANARVDISRSDIENSLHWEVDVEIPSTRAVPLALNRGQSLFDVGKVARRPMQELLARFVEPANTRVG